jgi:methyl-accepting chemotaxis protein
LGDEVTSERAGAKKLQVVGRHRLASDVQVLIGVGSLLALLAVAVGFAVILIVSFEDDATGDAQRHVRYANAIHGAALSAKAIANHQRGFLLSGDPEFTTEIRLETAVARDKFSLAASYAAGDAQRDAVAESNSQFERWLIAMQADLAAFRRGDRRQAIDASLGSTRALRKRYEETLAHAYELGTGSIDSATDSLSSSATRSVTFLLTYLGVALVVGVAIALWVVRAILRPAFALSQNAIEVLNTGYVVVGEPDERGSHHGISVVVPIEAVNALAESALETQESLRPGSTPAG